MCDTELGKLRVPVIYLTVSLFFSMFEISQNCLRTCYSKSTILSHTKKSVSRITMRPVVPPTLRGAQQRIARSKWTVPRGAGQLIQSSNLSLGLRSGISSSNTNTAALRLGSRGLSYTAHLRDQDKQQKDSSKNLLEDINDARKWSTPLAKQLAEAISV